MKNKLPQNSIASSTAFQISLALLITTVMTFLIYGVALAQGATQTQSPTNGNSTEVKAKNDIATLEQKTYKPYLIEIIDGASTATVASTQTNPENILDNAGFIIYPEDEYTLQQNNDLINKPLVGFKLVIDRSIPVKFRSNGVVSNSRTQSGTVAGLLAEKGIVLGVNDAVQPSLDTPLTSGIEVWVYGVGTRTITTDEVLPFSRSYVDDSSLASGAQAVVSPGKNGRASVTYKVTYYDGVESSRLKIRSLTVEQPINEIVKRGPVNTSGPLSAAQIQFLGSCEAGMNPTRNSGNGYYGAFQFSVGTWNAMGTGYARADLAPLDAQVAAVQKLLSRSSIFGQFPNCANQMVAAGLL